MEAICDGIIYAKDLPYDHIYGIKGEGAEDFNSIIQNRFIVESGQKNFDNIEEEYKPN